MPNTPCHRQSHRSCAVAVLSHLDRKEKTGKKASLKQIPINPAVQIVIMLPTSQVPRLGLRKAPFPFFREVL